MSTETHHPRGIFTVLATESWERMSYYGMQVLLVLFMVDTDRGGMGMRPERAVVICGLYAAMLYLAALPGGWVGDRLLGAKRAVWWGGLIITAGHLLLALRSSASFYLGLVFIAAGAGLLKPSVSIMIAQLYPEGGARRDAGFTLLFLGLNLGALMGHVLCSNLGENVSWRIAFIVAGAGMILGLVQFKREAHHLEGIGEKSVRPREQERRDWMIVVSAVGFCSVLLLLFLTKTITLDPFIVAGIASGLICVVALGFFFWAFLFAGLDSDERRRMAVISIFFLAAVTFFAGFTQSGSSFSLFAKDHTNRALGPWTLAAGMFQSLNPVFMIVLSPLVSALWLALSRRGRCPAPAQKMSWGLLSLALAFVIAAAAAMQAFVTGPVSPLWLVSIYFVLSFAEILLSPVGLSAVTKLAPSRLAGQMVGVWFLGTSLGNLIAGLVARSVAGESAARMPLKFMQMGGVLAGIGLLLWLCSRRIQKLMPSIQ